MYLSIRRGLKEKGFEMVGKCKHYSDRVSNVPNYFDEEPVYTTVVCKAIAFEKKCKDKDNEIVIINDGMGVLFNGEYNIPYEKEVTLRECCCGEISEDFNEYTHEAFKVTSKKNFRQFLNR